MSKTETLPKLPAWVRRFEKDEPEAVRMLRLSGGVLFAIEDTNFSKVEESETCPAGDADEIRREFKSRLKDWGGAECGYKLREFEFPVPPAPALSEPQKWLLESLRASGHRAFPLTNLSMIASRALDELKATAKQLEDLGLVRTCVVGGGMFTAPCAALTARGMEVVRG